MTQQIPTPYEYSPKCGDVLFTGSADGGFISEAIMRFTTGRGERLSRAHHQAQIVGMGCVVEALGELKHRRVVRRTFNERRTDCAEGKTFMIIFRPPTTPGARTRVMMEASGLVGKKYGYIEIMLKGVDGILKKLGLLKGYKQLFSKLGSLRLSTMICSRVGNRCQVRAGTMPPDAIHWAPDDTFDYAVDSNWEVVCMSEKSAGYWFPQT